jgi:hypothetical protein
MARQVGAKCWNAEILRMSRLATAANSAPFAMCIAGPICSKANFEAPRIPQLTVFIIGSVLFNNVRDTTLPPGDITETTE